MARDCRWMPKVVIMYSRCTSSSYNEELWWHFQGSCWSYESLEYDGKLRPFKRILEKERAFELLLDGCEVCSCFTASYLEHLIEWILAIIVIWSYSGEPVLWQEHYARRICKGCSIQWKEARLSSSVIPSWVFCFCQVLCNNVSYKWRPTSFLGHSSSHKS